MPCLTCVCLFTAGSGEKIRRLMESVSARCQSKKALAFPPHFSLRGDFKVKKGQLSTLSSELGKVVEKYPPLELKLTSYGFYPWRVVYLDVKKTGLLQELHEEAMEAIQNYRVAWAPEELKKSKHLSRKQEEYVKRYGYHFAFEYFSPHVTLAGNDINEPLFQKVKKKLEGKKENIKVVVDRVVLLDRNNKNRLLVEFKLKDKN